MASVINCDLVILFTLSKFCVHTSKLLTPRTANVGTPSLLRSLSHAHCWGVKLKLIDQIPISTDKSISVELTEKSEADFDKKSGKLLWNLNLSYGEILKKNFNYTIKYPEDKNIYGLN